MGHHRYEKHHHRREKRELNLGWLLEWRWLGCALLVATLGLYEANTWRSCSNNINYRYYKDLRIVETPTCTYDAETFRHRPAFAKECEDALRSTNADILHDNKWKCWWSEQPISFGKWEAVGLLTVIGYVGMRMYVDYRRRIEERRIAAKESRRALEYLQDSAMNMPRFGWPEELPFTKSRESRHRSPVRIEPYYD